MDDKYPNNEPSAGAFRETYHDASAASAQARAAVERKLRLRFAPKKEAGE